eukprot:2010104-Prymnesium_polylepis.1
MRSSVPALKNFLKYMITSSASIVQACGCPCRTGKQPSGPQVHSVGRGCAGARVRGRTGCGASVAPVLGSVSFTLES